MTLFKTGAPVSLSTGGSSSSGSSSSSLGPIIGGVVGAILVVVAAGYMYLRSKKKAMEGDATKGDHKSLEQDAENPMHKKKIKSKSAYYNSDDSDDGAENDSDGSTDYPKKGNKTADVSVAVGSDSSAGDESSDDEKRKPAKKAPPAKPAPKAVVKKAPPAKPALRSKAAMADSDEDDEDIL